MRVNLSPDEERDLSRQLRYLYVRELRNYGFTDEETGLGSGIAHPTVWRFETKFPELQNHTVLSHSEAMSGDVLIREAMSRVEQEENVVPRNMSERYVGKLRDAVKRMAMTQIVLWKRQVEEHAIRFIPQQEPQHTYMRERVFFKIWV